jgi:hypothetical protein
MLFIYSKHMLTLYYSCDINVNSGQIYGQVFTNQPSICALYMLSICLDTDSYIRSFAISVINTLVLVSSGIAYAEHILTIFLVLNLTTINIT